MAESIFDQGDLLRVTNTITDPLNSDAAVDPTALTVNIRDPSGNVESKVYGTDLEVVRSSTGVYYIDVNLDEPGRWWARWVATGTGQCVGEQHWKVKTPYWVW
jgi:hypothetical protein